MKPGKRKVRLHSADATVNFNEKTRLKSFIADLFILEGVDMEVLDYIFCSDEYLLNINKQFLKHDYPTDIITFPLSEKDKPVIGEIYISVDRVKVNSIEYGRNFKDEFLRVVFHGALHLCGFKDKSSADLKLMRKKEDEYLHKWFKK